MVPVTDLSRLLPRVFALLRNRLRVLLVLLAPLKNLSIARGGSEGEARGGKVGRKRSAAERRGACVNAPSSARSTRRWAREWGCRTLRHLCRGRESASPQASRSLPGHDSGELTLNHVLDEDRADGDIALDGEGLVVGAEGEGESGWNWRRGWEGRGGRRMVVGSVRMRGGEGRVSWSSTSACRRAVRTW